MTSQQQDVDVDVPPGVVDACRKRPTVDNDVADVHVVDLPTAVPEPTVTPLLPHENAALDDPKFDPPPHPHEHRRLFDWHWHVHGPNADGRVLLDTTSIARLMDRGARPWLHNEQCFDLGGTIYVPVGATHNVKAALNDPDRSDPPDDDTPWRWRLHGTQQVFEPYDDRSWTRNELRADHRGSIHLPFLVPIGAPPTPPAPSVGGRLAARIDSDIIDSVDDVIRPDLLSIDVLDGCLLYRSKYHLMFGPNGSGKTTMALAAAVSVIAEGRPVAVISAERSIFDVAAAMKRLGCDFSRPELLAVYDHLTVLEHGAEKVIDDILCGKVSPALVVVDSMGKLAGAAD